MQLSELAAGLRTALETAADSPAEVSETGPSRVRIAVPIAPGLSDQRWQAALAAVQQGDDWGTEGFTGTVTVWAEIDLRRTA